MHNGLAIPQVSGSFMCERMTDANLTLYNLADIADQSWKTLEFIKQEDAMAFEISMSTTEKSFKELSARQNNIERNLWQAKIKSCIAETFINEEKYRQHVFKTCLLVFALFVAYSSM